MLGPALEAAEFAIASFEARLDAKLGRPLRLALGRYAGVVLIGLPVSYVVCDFKWTRDGFAGVAAGVILYAMLQPFTNRGGRENSGPVGRFARPDLDVDDARGSGSDRHDRRRYVA